MISIDMTCIAKEVQNDENIFSKKFKYKLNDIEWQIIIHLKFIYSVVVW